MLENRLLTEAQASKYLGISRQFLRESRMSGRRGNRADAPPFVRFGKRGIRYDVCDLDRWIDQRRCAIPGGQLTERTDSYGHGQEGKVCGLSCRKEEEGRQ